MYFHYRNKGSDDFPKESVPIWACTKEGCNGWMRRNFAFECQPACPFCQSPMADGVKLLPLLVNSNDEYEAVRKGKRA